MISTQNKNDLSILNAQKYLVENNYGYVDDLKKISDFNNERIKEFCSLSFMRIGWTNMARFAIWTTILQNHLQ